MRAHGASPVFAGPDDETEALKVIVSTPFSELALTYSGSVGQAANGALEGAV